MATHQRTRPKSCLVCSADFIGHGNSRYCSSRCLNLNRERKRGHPCTVCGTLMWSSNDMAAEPTCLTCRRSKPSYRGRRLSPTETWTCEDCGVVGERPTVRGAKPRRRGDCHRLRGNQRIQSRAGIRLRIYERDEWTCWLCASHVDRTLIGSRSPWRPSLDHVTPVSLGGTHDESNLRLAHQWCNAVRGDGHMYSPEHFRT